MPETNPWYREPSAWGSIVAVVALVLSQLPPIKTWFSSPRIQTYIGGRLSLPHEVGIPKYDLMISLRNESDRSVVLSDLTLTVNYPDGASKSAMASDVMMLSIPSINFRSYPFTLISMPPGSTWEGSVIFSRKLTPAEVEEVAKIRLQIYKSMNKDDNFSQFDRKVLTRADPSVVQLAQKFFNKQFDLDKGEYKATISASVDGAPRILKTFGFVLYDYHIETIRSQVADFSLGHGIISPPSYGKHVEVVIDTNE